jgi:hypothetical protein
MIRTPPGLLPLLLAPLVASLGCSRGSTEGRGDERSTLLATLPGTGAPPPGVDAGQGAHTGLNPGGIEPVFGEGGGVAYAFGGTDGVRVFHGGKTGEPYRSVGDLAVSPDGRRCAYAAQRGDRWHLVLDGAEQEGWDEVRGPSFSPDGAHVAYQARRGGRWRLVVDGKARQATPGGLVAHAFGADGSRIAFVDQLDAEGKQGRLVVADVGLSKESVVSAGVSRFVISDDGKRLAAVAAAGNGQRVLTASLESPDRAEPGPRFDAVEALALSPDGLAAGYLAQREGKRLAVLGSREEPLGPWTPVGKPSVRPGGAGIGLLAESGGWVVFRTLLGGEASAPAEPFYEEAEGLSWSRDGRSHAYAARRGQTWYVVANGKEGPAFDRVVSPAFTPDGRHLVYRARQRGTRFVVVADANGQTVKRLPSHELVYPVRIAPDGRSIGYGTRDGQQLAWKAEGL